MQYGAKNANRFPSHRFATQIDAGDLKYDLAGSSAEGRRSTIRLLHTAFSNQQAGRSVPKGARSAVVKIVRTRAGSDGYNHGFADVTSLVLRESGT